MCATEPSAYLEKEFDDEDLLRDDIEDKDGEELLTVNLTPKNQTTKFEPSKFRFNATATNPMSADSQIGSGVNKSSAPNSVKGSFTA